MYHIYTYNKAVFNLERNIKAYEYYTKLNEPVTRFPLADLQQQTV